MIYLAAGSGKESLFWLVMAVVWVVVQIISRSAKKKRGQASPARPPPPSSAQPDTSLEDFLRSLGAEPALPPSPVVEPEPAPMVAAEPAPPVRIRKRRAPRPLTPPPPSPAPAPAGPEPGEAYEQAIKPPPGSEVVRTGQRIRGMMVIPKIPVINVRSLRVPGLVFQGSSINNRSPGPGRFPLKGRAALRQAMLHRLILEPPHVFEV